MRRPRHRRGARLGVLSMSHLHLPDGVLPPWIWIGALLLVLGILALAGRAIDSRRVAYQGALAAMMLAAMAVPLGPVDFHLSLAGPVGVLLGAAAGFQVVFVVSLILAFIGHGGLTAVGLNTLVLGLAAATASVVYGALARRLAPAPALALATATGQILSGLLWFGVVTLALRAPVFPASLAAHPPRLEVVSAVVIALWILGLLIETVVAYGVAQFLARVHPALLPATRLSGESA